MGQSSSLGSSVPEIDHLLPNSARAGKKRIINMRIVVLNFRRGAADGQHSKLKFLTFRPCR